MEERQWLNKNNIISFLLILLIVVIVIVTKISIDKVEEQEALEKIENTVETPDYEAEVEVEKPVKTDVTWQEYNTTIYEIETNNVGRYDFNYIENILEENVKTTGEAKLTFSKDTSEVAEVFDTSCFIDYNGIWYPDEGLVILISKVDVEKSDDFVKDLRDFTTKMAEKLQGTGLSHLYTDYKHTVSNGYNVIMICDNSDIAFRKVRNYMVIEDELAVKEYTDKFYIENDGIFYKEGMKDLDAMGITNKNNEENIEENLGQLPGNITDLEMYENTEEVEESTEE